MKIAWEKNFYSGVVICSSGKTKTERKIVIERIGDIVSAHIFRY